MSKIEVNTVEPQCGTTLTLGGSGDTVALGSGASQTGFGRTGTVDWITTPKVTGDSPITGVTGKGYFLNTTAGTITINLPAGAAGSIISMADYAATWQTNNVTVTPNGTDKIGALNASVTLNTEGQSVTFVYVDSTQGWINTMDSTSNVRGLLRYVTATGGCITTCGNFKMHTFLATGTFCVSCAGQACGSNTVDYLVVAGGGGAGGYGHGAGGGAGGYRESPGTASGSYTVSPLGVSPAVALPVPATPYAITVGGGGAGNPAADGSNGNLSTFSTITSAGGGFGSRCTGSGGPGGSGGGAGNGTGRVGGTGNDPSTTPAQGTNGGNGSADLSPGFGGGGGGGATVTGVAGTGTTGGNGGNGATSSINLTPTARAGGGGGSIYNRAAGCAGSGGTGGGGAGSNLQGAAGGINTGGGGGGSDRGAPGGSCTSTSGGAGGSGIVIIRYKFQ